MTAINDSIHWEAKPTRRTPRLPAGNGGGKHDRSMSKEQRPNIEESEAERLLCLDHIGPRIGPRWSGVLLFCLVSWATSCCSAFFLRWLWRQAASSCRGCPVVHGVASAVVWRLCELRSRKSTVEVNVVQGVVEKVVENVGRDGGSWRQ